MTREKIIEMFIENARKAAAGVYQAKNMEEVNETLAGILGDTGKIFRSGLTDLENKLVIAENRLTGNFLEADFSVEEVPAAVAETGSLVSTSANSKQVEANLLPSHHVAVLAGENIFATVEDYLESVASNPPTNITFETGPSRTADIELTLTTGVHGPERLTIIII